MKRKTKIVFSFILIVIIALFVFNHLVYADEIDIGTPSSVRHSNYYNNDYDDDDDNDVLDNKDLIEIIIVLLAIILIMGIVILKYLYSKYSIEIKITKKDENPSINQSVTNTEMGAQANFTDTQEFKEELADKVIDQVENKDVENNDENIKLELDMTKLFAVMLIIVGVLIIVAVVS